MSKSPLLFIAHFSFCILIIHESATLGVGAEGGVIQISLEFDSEQSKHRAALKPDNAAEL